MKTFTGIYIFYVLLFWLSFSITSLKAESNKVSVSEKGVVVTMENNLVSVKYDLSHGTYSVVNKIKSTTCITDASFTLNEFRSSNGFESEIQSQLILKI